MHPHGAPMIPHRPLPARRPVRGPSTAPGRLVALGMALALAWPAAHATELAVRDAGTGAGYLTIGWDGTGAQAIELQQRGPGPHGWRTIYEGRDGASALSGLPDGVYAFRARAGPSGDWSQPLEVTIAHHPLPRALASFAAGAFMFAILLACIAAPHRRGAGS